MLQTQQEVFLLSDETVAQVVQDIVCHIGQLEETIAAPDDRLSLPCVRGVGPARHARKLCRDLFR